MDPLFEYLLIVRRDCEDKLAFLRRAFAQRNSVKVIADRRVSDRRTRREEVGEERRRSDRRGIPPPSWDVADYVLVPVRQPSAETKTAS
jgi:hypothetical protein